MSDAPSSPGTEGLLPCPFCGTADPLLIDGTENEVGYFVRCEYCRLDYPQPLMNSAEKAIAIWNTRFPSPGTKLLPCPFCGGAMEEVTDEDGHYFVHPGRVGMQRADCWLCDAWVSDEESGEGSIGEWNARLGITSVAQAAPEPAAWRWNTRADQRWRVTIKRPVPTKLTAFDKIEPLYDAPQPLSIAYSSGNCGEDDLEEIKGKIARAIYDVSIKWIEGNFPPDHKFRDFSQLDERDCNLHFDYADAVLKALSIPSTTVGGAAK